MKSHTKTTAKKPLIGVTMHYDHFDEVKKGVRYRFIREEYGQAITRAGGEVIFIDGSISPRRAAKLCDGIVISGGEDIDPALYGEAKQGSAWIEPLERTLFERELIDACDEIGVPILGICYGSQLLNIHYGGSLYQDIASQCGARDHGTSSKAALGEIIFKKSCLGFKARSHQSVAHRHHQAVARLGDGLHVVARALDGTVEAIAGRGHVGIQWHPEADGSADAIYGPFVRSCRLGKTKRRATLPLRRGTRKTLWRKPTMSQLWS
ncbi:gamma-glutamyl-gamma-aminobutyrate hydrolase family protein [Candidatus Saccharibacteria bacterium]|nr:gamma-glutamyl-gamma-aminobutyrate hydrolase family protein [Candidatus Saccharibacteria bacterium]